MELTTIDRPIMWHAQPDVTNSPIDLLAKRTGRRRVKPLYRNRPTVLRLRAKLTKTVAKFLRAQAPKMAEQINTLRAKYMRKAELTADEQDTLERILAELDFTGWAVLAGDSADVLQALIDDAGYAALLQVGIDTSAQPEVVNVVNDFALGYAQDRSAEMIGMRRTALGTLEPNPNAEWQITESTRYGVRGVVADALKQGWSNDELAAALADSYAFSTDRAMVIARTETQLATQQGALAGYKASGVVDGKQWLTADDDRVSEECEANGEAGPNGDGVLMDLDAVFPSGDDAPPVHPNCRCAIVPYVSYDNVPAQADTGDTES